MCGRYAITLPPETYRELYGYSEQPNFPPRYNVAPTQPVPIVLEDRGERHFMLVRWGFLPSWVKDPKDFPLVINARGETLQTKPTFKAALKRRRCIFLADGFYEWRRHGREKTPFLIRLRDRGPMPLALCSLLLCPIRTLVVLQRDLHLDHSSGLALSLPALSYIVGQSDATLLLV